MKKIAILALILITTVFVYQVPAQSRTPKQIQFAKGRSSAVINGTTGSNGVTYIVKARSGQKLVLSLTPVSEIGIKVTTDGVDGQTVLLSEEKGGTYEIGLEENGDYTIFIGSTNNKSIAFTLTVKITKLADI